VSLVARLLPAVLVTALVGARVHAEEVIVDPEDSSAPAERASTPDGEERVADLEDSDTRAPTGQKQVADDTPLPGLSASPVVWSARGQLRLAFDIWHERETAGSYEGYREDTLELLLQTAARLEYRPKPWLQLRLGGRIQYHLTSTRPSDTSDSESEMLSKRSHRNELDAEFTELSLQVSSSWLDLTAGLVTVVWGVSNLVNPNDVMTARDLRLGPLADSETGRLPVPTMSLQGELKGVTVVAYWQPLFLPNRVDLFGSDYALCGPAASLPLQRLGETVGRLVDDSVEGNLQHDLLQTRRPSPFVDPVLGARVAWRLGGWDVALQYAWLFERLPHLRLKPDLSVLPLLTGDLDELTDDQMQQIARWATQQPSPAEGIYRRNHHAGISVSGTIWRLAVNLDLAYQSLQSAPLGGDNPLVDDGGGGWYTASADSQAVAYTLGMTYLSGESFLATLEWWHLALVDIAGDATQPPLLLGGPHYGGLALLVRYRLSAINLAFQAAIQSDLLNPSVVICPRVVYRHGDHLGLMVGANLFEGTRRSIAGKLGQNDQLFVGIEGYL